RPRGAAVRRLRGDRRGAGVLRLVAAIGRAAASVARRQHPRARGGPGAGAGRRAAGGRSGRPPADGAGPVLTAEEYVEDLLKGAMGWLGWPPEVALDTPMPLIALGLDGR